MLTLQDRQQHLKIETNDLDYVVIVVLAKHGHTIAYHNETLFDMIHKYTAYDKDMYSIMQAYC